MVHATIRRIGLFLVALHSCIITTRMDASTTDSNNLFIWESALSGFRQVGALLDQKKFPEAETALTQLTKKLPDPYAAQANKAREALTRALGEKVAAANTGRKVGFRPDDYEQQIQLAAICSSLSSDWEAARYYARALKLQPEPGYKLVNSFVTSLINADADEAHFKQLEQRVAHPSLQAECRTALEGIRQRRHARQDLTLPVAAFWGLPPLVRLRDVKATEDRLQPDTQRQRSYQEFILHLSRMGDTSGRDAWEARLLTEYPDQKDSLAALYCGLGESALRSHRADEALRHYRRVVQAFAASKSFGVAQYNLGVILQDQGKYDRAIAEYSRLLESQVNDQDPGGHIMETHRSYRHRAAIRTSECYEAKGDFASAQEFAGQAHHKHRLYTFCGTCAESDKHSLELRSARLALRINPDKGLVLAEPLLMRSYSMELALLVVDVYRKQNQVHVLLGKIAAGRQQNVKEHLAAGFKRNDKEYDGNSLSMKVAEEYIQLLALADAQDVDGLWQYIADEHCSAFEADFSQYTARHKDTWRVQKAAELLVSLGEVAKPLLRARVAAYSREQGWALVLLARMKAPEAEANLRSKLLPALSHSSKHLPGTFEVDSSAGSFWSSLTQDYFYALGLLGSPDASELLRKFADHPNYEFRQFAMNVLKRLNQQLGGDEESYDFQ